MTLKKEEDDHKLKKTVFCTSDNKIKQECIGLMGMHDLVAETNVLGLLNNRDVYNSGTCHSISYANKQLHNLFYGDLKQARRLIDLGNSYTINSTNLQNLQSSPKISEKNVNDKKDVFLDPNGKGCHDSY